MRTKYINMYKYKETQTLQTFTFRHRIEEIESNLYIASNFLLDGLRRLGECAIMYSVISSLLLSVALRDS